jgi:hypothetical protein
VQIEKGPGFHDEVNTKKELAEMIINNIGGFYGEKRA